MTGMRLCRPDTAGLTKRNSLRIKPSRHRDWLNASVCLRKLDNSDFLRPARPHSFASKTVPGMMLIVAIIVGEVALNVWVGTSRRVLSLHLHCTYSGLIIVLLRV